MRPRSCACRSRSSARPRRARLERPRGLRRLGSARAPRRRRFGSARRLGLGGSRGSSALALVRGSARALRRRPRSRAPRRGCLGAALRRGSALRRRPRGSPAGGLRRGLGLAAAPARRSVCLLGLLALRPALRARSNLCLLDGAGLLRLVRMVRPRVDLQLLNCWRASRLRGSMPFTASRMTSSGRRSSISSSVLVRSPPG